MKKFSTWAPLPKGPDVLSKISYFRQLVGSSPSIKRKLDDSESVRSDVKPKISYYERLSNAQDDGERTQSPGLRWKRSRPNIISSDLFQDPEHEERETSDEKARNSENIFGNDLVLSAAQAESLASALQQHQQTPSSMWKDEHTQTDPWVHFNLPYFSLSLNMSQSEYENLQQQYLDLKMHLRLTEQEMEGNGSSSCLRPLYVLFPLLLLLLPSPLSLPSCSLLPLSSFLSAILYPYHPFFLFFSLTCTTLVVRNQKKEQEMHVEELSSCFEAEKRNLLEVQQKCVASSFSRSLF